MIVRCIKLLLWAAVLVPLIACQSSPTAAPPPAEPAALPIAATVIASGLLNPVGVEPLPDGGLLIAEEGSGENDTSAGVTLLQADGRQGRLISNLPSGRDAGDLSGVPFVKWSPEKIYLSHFNQGALLTLPLSPAEPLTIPETPFGPADLAREMEPLNAVQLQNPFDMVLDEEGRPVVSDATANGLATTNAEGQTLFFHRFEPLDNPGSGKPTIEAVPTGLTQINDEFVVTLTGGCPYPPDSGLLVAVNRKREQRTLAEGLNLPIDVAQDAAGTIWILELARFNPDGSCFGGDGYLPHTGRLSYLTADGAVQPLITELNFPGSLAFDQSGDLIVSEIFSGRVLRFTGVQAGATPVSMNTLLENGTTAAPPSPVSQKLHTYFLERGVEHGLIFQHGAFATALSADPVAMMGAGLCWIDFNNDGWLDLYLVNSHALAEQDHWAAVGDLPRNTLLQNEEGLFIDVSRPSGSDLALRGNGCIAADLNGDGWTDLYVTADGPNALLWNQGDGTFVEGAAAAGVAASEWNSAASAGDLNGDGLLDLFVAAYIDLEKQIDNPVGAFPQDFFGLPDHLYLNKGDGTFRDVAATVGLTLEERGLGSLMSDFDLDGDLDLYIANDGHPNRLYINEAAAVQPGFRLLDVSQSSNTNDSGSGMGIAAGDYDNNGWFDLLVTNWDTELNALYRNQTDQDGKVEFRYSTFQIGMTGLGNNLTGWGTVWADFDHDGDEDLLVVNGHVPITDLTADAQLVRLYDNRLAEGLPGQLRDITGDVGLDELGVGPLRARGSAAADFDNDGDIDVAINTIGGAAVLLENIRSDGHWLMIQFARPQSGIRAVLTLPDGSMLSRELHAGSSYLASEDPRLHFGLGDFAEFDALTIYYPDGAIEEMDGGSADRTVYPRPGS